MSSIFLGSSPYKKIHKELHIPNQHLDFLLPSEGKEEDSRTQEGSQLGTPNKELISDRYIPLRGGQREHSYNLLEQESLPFHSHCSPSPQRQSAQKKQEMQYNSLLQENLF